MNTKISIIVPVYNVAEYLPRCLESCIRQTLHDIEIICVDDGSTDNSLEILRHYARMDNRILVIHQENKGLPGARNTGLAAAHGDFIMFLDSDDYYAPNACERVWVETKEAPTDIVIFGTEVVPAYPQPEEWYAWTLHTRTQRFWNFSPEVLFENPSAKPFVWRQAFSAELLKNTGIVFDESLRYGEDVIFQMKIFPQATHFAFISDRLYNYRWSRPDSLMNSQVSTLDAKLTKHISVVEATTAYWAEQNWFQKYGGEYLTWVLQYIVPDILSQEGESLHQHGRRLYKVIQKYGLEQYRQSLNMENKVLLKKIGKM